MSTGLDYKHLFDNRKTIERSCYDFASDNPNNDNLHYDFDNVGTEIGLIEHEVELENLKHFISTELALESITVLVELINKH